MNLMSIARAVRTLSLGIWLGGIVMAFIAARIVFDEKIGLGADRMRAGGIVLTMLQSAGTLKTILALAALVAESLIFFRRGPDAPQGWRKYVPAGGLLLAFTIALFTILWLQPHILELRDKISDFSPKSAGSPERIEFGKWHGASMGLLAMEALLVAIAQAAGVM